MRAPMLGLAIATVAFGGSSLYLWQQLGAERTRAAQSEQTMSQLKARIADLERTHTQSPWQRAPGSDGPGSARAPTAPNIAAVSDSSPAQQSSQWPVWTEPSPLQMAAFEKMRRNQIRGATRRMYGSIGEKLGLSKAKADALVELLAEQQMELTVGRADPAEGEFEQKQHQLEAAIADLIGPDKAAALAEYQATLPVRGEFENLARQLEDNDAALNDAQRKQLLTVFIDERKRVPMPEYADGMDGAAYAKAVSAWWDEYNKRVSEEASHILDSEQLTAYNEIQQMQKDMRDHFASAGMLTTVPGETGGIAGPTNVVTFTSATPAFFMPGPVINAAPAPIEPAKSPER